MASEYRTYADWIRQRPCALCLGPGPCHAHHHTEGLTYDPDHDKPRKALGGKRGKGQRAHDVFLIPVHLRCHGHIHQFTGPCRDWDQAKRRAWQDTQVAELRAEYEAFLERNPISTPAVKRAPRSASSGPATPGDAVSRAWVAGANAERARIAEWLFEAAARVGAPDAHQALIDHHEALKATAEPMARMR